MITPDNSNINTHIPDAIFASDYREGILHYQHLKVISETVVNPVSISLSGLVAPSFVLAKYLITKISDTTKIYSLAPNHGYLIRAEYLILLKVDDTKVEAEFCGSAAKMEEWEDEFKTDFPPLGRTIQWVYGDHGDSTDRPLNRKPFLRTAYPWIEGDVGKYVEEFYASSANILVLIGPPGTGKTSFLKELIHLSGRNATVTYNEKFMGSDTFFARFIMNDDSGTIIMEDADHFIGDRVEDGNDNMHRFLNVGDGLVSNADKKLIFTTNLPNISSIDSALIRPGRCFDVMSFRPLDRKEALAVVEESGNGKVLSDGNSFTLAQIMGELASDTKPLRRKVGF